MAVETIIDTPAITITRGTGPDLPPEGRASCSIREWNPDVDSAVREHDVTRFLVSGDDGAMAATLRQLERMADRVHLLRLGRPKRELDLAPVNSMHALEELELNQSPDSLDFARLGRLKTLSLSYALRFGAIAKIPALDYLRVSEGSKGLRDLTPLSGLSVREIWIDSANSLQTLDGAGELRNVQTLRFDVNRGLKSVRALSAVGSLRKFHIYGSRGVDDLGEIGAHPNMETFDLNNGPVLPSFEIFGHMKRLRVFFLNSTNVGPGAMRIEPLASLPELRKLMLRAGPTRGFKAITDVETLAQATQLEELYLDRMRAIDGFDLVAGMKALRELTLGRTVVRNPDASALRGLAHLLKLDLEEKVVKRMTREDILAIATPLLAGNWGWHHEALIREARAHLVRIVKR